MKKTTNRLIRETSPYLLQHAHNPVEWFPWGEEAFRKSEMEDKPILLSVGYAACHWCHVMAHESFEDEETARLMNALFINIKVDREERPDVDQVYMQFLHMSSGSGGWPMTVFLTSDRKPFFGGTYFPPDDRYGRPGFKKVLQWVSDFYHQDKTRLEQILLQVSQGYTTGNKETGLNTPSLVLKESFEKGVRKLAHYYEPQYGGLGQAPKFPAVQGLTAFLRYSRNTGDKRYLEMVTHTLTRMAKGGIFDQIGGGFARYSVDDKWLVPHFEKMLYDNAQLASLYLDTFLVTGDAFFLKVARRTLTFMSRDLRAPEGGFYSSFDADSDGQEGVYYIWDKQEIMSLLGEQTGTLFCDYYGVTEGGNFEGSNILHVAESADHLAKRYNIEKSQVEAFIEWGRDQLHKARQQRTPPGLDDKIIASWNGLALSAFAKAFQITGDPGYEEIVRDLVRFLQDYMIIKCNVKRTWKEDQAKYDGYLSDYANIIQGLLDAYEALFDLTYLRLAIQLLEYSNAHFLDEEGAGFYFTSNDQEQLIHRLKDEQDQSIPSGMGIMVMNHLRVYAFTGNQRLIEVADRVFQKYMPQMVANPYGYASYLNALDFYLEKPKEILILKSEYQSAGLFLKNIHSRYLPNKTLVMITPGHQPEWLTESLFKGREQIDGKITVYVCQNFTCSLPVTEGESLSTLLGNSY